MRSIRRGRVRPATNELESARPVHPSPRAVRAGVHRRVLRTGLPVSLLLTAFLLHVAAGQLDARSAAVPALTPTLPYSDALARFGIEEVVDVAGVTPAPVPVGGTFRRGETLAGVLQGLGLDAVEAHRAVSALSEHLDVRRIRAGDPYTGLYRAGSRQLESLEVPVPGVGRAVARRSGGGWEGGFVPFEKRMVPRTAIGVVEGSLIGAVVGAGASAQLAYRMADVLQWDMDFSRDLRRGDRFQVVYDEVQLDGRPAGVGPVWALSFESGGRTLEAYRYDGDYYDGEGRPLQKMFLRSPLRYSFVTSHFSPRRLHPVLKTYRPHWGVDYRARVGTPVLVTASGVVTFAGWSKGGGKMVKVRHANGYLTAYLHLSRYAPGIRPGRRVQQGEVIAYSGNTGLSTAPHLDYRVQKAGRWIDPLKLDNVPAEPIPEERRAEFLAWRDTCRTALELGAPLTARPGDRGGAAADVEAVVAARGAMPAPGTPVRGMAEPDARTSLDAPAGAGR